jgi:protein SCO1
MPRRISLLILASVLGLLILVGLAWRMRAVTPPSPPEPGGDFELVDQTGKMVHQDVLRGKWTVVFFGFTYCPDVCPTTLAALGEAQALLGSKAARLQMIFISLDPERDTPAQLTTYLSNDGFPKGMIGLTGRPDQVAAVAKAYRVYFEKNGAGADYLINHSTASYLMDPKGRFARVLPYGISPDEIANQITKAMAN